ncbi:hypothetical protein CYMTET_17061 [Cymbomonas tetramitiformis]|uniref:Uncharacterized protein n=1 Tax=Cymbomonas tetramitiformis TaxID=36881 RepID=A0AAE0GC83_9CHLO|nr:hypothetical protein CYMTET_17061 [Cymbomonas tetramitiformis]
MVNALIVEDQKSKQKISAFNVECREAMHHHLIPSKTFGEIEMPAICAAYEKKYGVVLGERNRAEAMPAYKSNSLNYKYKYNSLKPSQEASDATGPELPHGMLAFVEQKGHAGAAAMACNRGMHKRPLKFKAAKAKFSMTLSTKERGRRTNVA